MTSSPSFALAQPETQRYRLLAPIARGGMAELHLAATHGPDECTKLVAIKRVWPELAHEPEFVSMFTDEARLAVRLNHPNVVQTFDVGRLDGRLFMAMELLEGQTLNALLSRLREGDRFPLPLRLSVLSSVLAGLHYAHELADYDGTPLHVVHRDVSPQNIFITYNGGVKLLDFGIAKTMAASHQTMPGVMKGRVAYMAPESVRGQKPDRRADLFSVGVMLWEVAAGRRFWQGETETGILRRLLSGAPLDVPPLPESAPPGLEDLCKQAMAIEPGERPATAADMQIAIDRMVAGSVDSYHRQLGALVTHAFKQERQQMRALIERRLLGEPATAGEGVAGPASGSFAVVKPIPAEVVPLVSLEELAEPPWWRRGRKVSVLVSGVAAGLTIAWLTVSGAKQLQPSAAADPTAVPERFARAQPQQERSAAEALRLPLEEPVEPQRAPNALDLHRADRRTRRKRHAMAADTAPVAAVAAPSPEPAAPAAPKQSTEAAFDEVLTRSVSPPKNPLDVSNPYE